MNKQQAVHEFHQAFGLLINDHPTLVDSNLNDLRVALIQEELDEYRKALDDRNIVEIADALADLLYVVYGAGCTHGINLDPIFEEVHKSNMSKKDGYKNEAGKWMKPDTWEPPKLKPILDNQNFVVPTTGTATSSELNIEITSIT